MLDAEGRPAPGSRALPDGEIAAGTPIPALVPLPGLAMAPVPGDRKLSANRMGRSSGWPWMLMIARMQMQVALRS